MEISQFEIMIRALMAPENNVRGQAEAAFHQAKESPDALVPGLVHLLRHNDSEQVRRGWDLLPPQIPRF